MAARVDGRMSRQEAEQAQKDQNGGLAHGGQRPSSQRKRASWRPECGEQAWAAMKPP